MKRYDFDTEYDRRNTMSYKWDTLPMNFSGRTDLIPMWVADMDFRCPDEVVEAVTKAAQSGIYGYTYPSKPLGEVYAPWLEKRHGWHINKNNVCFCGGIVPALNMAVRAFTDPGDGVLVMSPVYYPFTEAIENNGRNAVRSSLKYDGERWTIDFDDLRRKASQPDVKLLLLCSPHNPVARVFTREELETIGDICSENDITIFSDEIHSDIVFKPNKHIPTASVSEKLAEITVTAVSPAKTFNLAGLQTSAILSENDRLFETISGEARKCVHLTNLFGTVAVETVYQNGEEYLEQLLDYLWGNYLELDEYLKINCPLITVQKPEGTYLMWLDCRKMGLNDVQLEAFFLDGAKVAPDFGKWFGKEGEGYARINIACPRSQLRKALSGIKSAYDRLGKDN